MRKLILFLAAVSLVLSARKALCYETTFSIEPESFNSFRYEEMRVEGPIELSIRTGRFLSVDPVMDQKKARGAPQLWNRYSYVMNSPTRYTDPDGRECGGCAAFERDVRELQAGKITVEEYNARINARGAGAAAGLLTLGAAYLATNAPTVIAAVTNYFLGRPGSVQQAGQIVADFASPPGPSGMSLQQIPVSAGNLRHIEKHLPAFRKLDPSMTLEAS